MKLHIHTFVLPVLFITLPFCSMAQSALAPASKQASPSPIIKKGQKITYKTIPAEGNTWGYEVLVDGVPYIRQLSIPGIQGNKGFANKNQAEETAKLVTGKLRNNIMPPIVTAEELSRITATVK